MDVAKKRPLCPWQLMWFQLVERRAPPPPPRLGNKHLFFHMTCRGTERVFVNPAVCRLASAWRHKPLSAASPLTRVGARLGPGPGWGGLACAPPAAPGAGGRGASRAVLTVTREAPGRGVP